jgi:hypothetical protein
VDHPDYHHYPSFYALQPLKEAIAGWYQRRFQANLESHTEVLPLLGSTDGLFNIHLCLLDPGDIALIPDPCYPSYASATQLAGGQVERFPLLRENDFLPDLEAIPDPRPDPHGPACAPTDAPDRSGLGGHDHRPGLDGLLNQLTQAAQLVLDLYLHDPLIDDLLSIIEVTGFGHPDRSL